MTLAAGTRLGPYDILAPLGAGGMGEVYRARDARLSREVAIKVLPVELSSDRERLSRFEQEARSASALNHPNIVTVYEIGQAESVFYIAMELVEGKTLRELVAAGPLAMKKLLPIAAQVADGLAKAHAAGIVHRDLKPENLMVSTDGFVKILDFGLAKLVPTSSEPLSAMQTVGTPETHPGSVLGTVGYMSPEQASGQAVDFRSDQFSFGSILYEMATGKRAFQRATAVDTLSAILHEEPEAIGQLNREVPPPCRWIVDRCLAKDPEERYASTRDLARDLASVRDHISEVSGSGEGTLAALPAVARRKSRERLGGVVIGLVVGAVAAGFGAWSFTHAHRPRAAPLARLSVTLPSDAPLAAYGAHNLALSPDGTHLVYAAERAGTTQLYLRAMDQLEATPIRNSEGASSPFFSPDSQWLAFFAGNKLKKVLVEGGTPQPICDAVEVRGASWGPADTIVFATGTSGLRRVSATGGTPQVVSTPDTKKGEVQHQFPEILPGGEAALFDAWASGKGQIAVLSLKTGKRRNLIEGTNAHYVPTGHLVFMRAESLLAAPFDLRRLELTGPAVPVLEGIMSLAPFGIGSGLFALSSNGTLVYAPGGSVANHALVWVDRRGTVQPLTSDPRAYEEPRLSPDGRRVAVTFREANPDVWVYEIPGGTLTRLTFDPGEDETPIWTPDGRRVTYSSDRSGQPRSVYWKAADGSAAEERLFTSEHHPHVSSWSPDGRALAFTDFDPVTGGDIWVFPLQGRRAPHPFLRTPFNERAARFSPDGRWLAYVSNESGSDEVYVQPFPGPEGKWQVSTNGGTEPVWSPKGGELFYRSGEKMMAVNVVSGQTFSAENPRVLFEGRFVPTRRGDATYDVSPDGQRFLMVKRNQQSTPAQLNVVLNWFEDLKRRVPAGKK